MNIEDIRKPGMPVNDWKFILKRMEPHFTMVEWGSGGSTTFFSYFVKKYISFEHSKQWFEDTIKTIEKERRANIILYWVNAPNYDYTEYTNKISTIEDKIDALSGFGGELSPHDCTSKRKGDTCSQQKLVESIRAKTLGSGIGLPVSRCFLIGEPCFLEILAIFLLFFSPNSLSS